MTAQDLYVARKDRAQHPDGRFDKAGCWYPSADESRPCCRPIREPSRSYPYSLMRHCRTLRHCRQLQEALA